MMGHIFYEELLMRGLLSNRAPARRNEAAPGKVAAQPPPAARAEDAAQAE